MGSEMCIRDSGDPGLLDDRPGVEVLGHEVDGAAVLRHPRLEGPLVGPEPWERRQQGGVDVDEPAREAPRESGPEDPHESGEHDEVRPLRSVHPLGQRIVELGPRAKGPVIEGMGRDTRRPCALQSGSPGDVAQNLRDRAPRVDQRLQVGATS